MFEDRLNCNWPMRNVSIPIDALSNPHMTLEALGLLLLLSNRPEGQRVDRQDICTLRANHEPRWQVCCSLNLLHNLGYLEDIPELKHSHSMLDVDEYDRTHGLQAEAQPLHSHSQG